MERRTRRTCWIGLCLAALLSLPWGAAESSAADSPPAQTPAAGDPGDAGAFVPGFLAETAHHYATRLGGVPGKTLPAAATYLQNAMGAPSAYVAVYKLAAPDLDPHGLSEALVPATDAVLAAMNDEDDAGLGAGLKALRRGRDYLTVIVGATPLQPKLISLSPGLPPHVFAEVGRTVVARRAGVDRAAVEVGTPVVNADMPKGMDMGFTYDVSGEPYLYLLPSASHPEGEVLRTSAYLGLREELEISAAREILLLQGEAADEVSADLARRTLARSRLANARSWGKLAAALGHQETAGLCERCATEAIEAIAAGAVPVASAAYRDRDATSEGDAADVAVEADVAEGGLAGGPDEGGTGDASVEADVAEGGPADVAEGIRDATGTSDGGTADIADEAADETEDDTAEDGEYTECECYRTMGDFCDELDREQEYWVSSCDDFDVDQDCCDYENMAYDEEQRCYVLESESIWDSFCNDSCHCDCKHYYTLEDVDFGGLFLRGVPTLHQHRIDGQASRCEDERIFTGCTPVAGTALVSWFDMLGANELGDDYRDGSALDWQALVEDMRSGDYMNTGDCDNGTPTRNFESGLQAYFDDKGICAEVDKEKLKHGDESEHASLFQRIREHIQEHRPVGLAYGTLGDEPEHEHAALITGYFEENGDPYIYVNTGWGSGDNEIYEFEVTSGNIHLIFVEGSLTSCTGSLTTGDRMWCAAESLSTYFLDAGSITYTMSPYSHDESEYQLGWGYAIDDLPLYERCIPGSDTCALLGGVGDYVSYTRSSEDIECNPSFADPRVVSFETRQFSVIVKEIPYVVEEIFLDFYPIRVYTPFPPW